MLLGFSLSSLGLFGAEGSREWLEVLPEGKKTSRFWG